MSRLEKLIAELCPDGVEFRQLRRVFDIFNGYTPSKSNATYWEEGTIPWFRMEDIRNHGRILHDSIQHINPEAIRGKLFPANSIIISTLATIGLHALVTVDYLANQQFTCLSMKTEYKSRLDPKFIFYYGFILDEWCLNNVNVASFASVDMEKFGNFKVPIPPLPVQKEIVRILDQYSAAEQELETQLDAELEAREKQYAYYRDALLDFSPGKPRISSKHSRLNKLIETFCPDGVDYRQLNNIGMLTRGNGLQKTDFSENGVGCIHYGQIYTYYGLFAYETKSFVTQEMSQRLKKVNPGDLIITLTSENIEDVCKCVAWLGNESIVTGGHAAIFKHNQNPKYIAYCFQSDQFYKQKCKIANGTKVIEVSPQKLEKILIPIPPLEIQNEIVRILDQFDTLVNDIKQGLPAEISARRKQYEYYREKLLTFKEKQP